MLARNIAKYFSDSSVPSQIFSISSLVPEMIWIRLFNSLATRGVMGASPTAGFSCCSFMIGPGAPYLARQPSTLAAFAVPYCGRDQLGYDAGRTYLRHSQIVTYRIVAARFIGASLRQVQLDAAASWLKTPVLVHREPGTWIFSNERLERMSTLLGNWDDCSAFGPAPGHNRAIAGRAARLPYRLRLRAIPTNAARSSLRHWRKSSQLQRG